MQRVSAPVVIAVATTVFSRVPCSTNSRRLTTFRSELRRSCPWSVVTPKAQFSGPWRMLHTVGARKYHSTTGESLPYTSTSTGSAATSTSETNTATSKKALGNPGSTAAATQSTIGKPVTAGTTTTSATKTNHYGSVNRMILVGTVSNQPLFKINFESNEERAFFTVLTSDVTPVRKQSAPASTQPTTATAATAATTTTVTSSVNYTNSATNINSTSSATASSSTTTITWEPTVTEHDVVCTGPYFAPYALRNLQAGDQVFVSGELMYFVRRDGTRRHRLQVSYPGGEIAVLASVTTPKEEEPHEAALLAKLGMQTSSSSSSWIFKRNENQSETPLDDTTSSE